MARAAGPWSTAVWTFDSGGGGLGVLIAFSNALYGRLGARRACRRGPLDSVGYRSASNNLNLGPTQRHAPSLRIARPQTVAVSAKAGT
jgi:hypothetical protein